jgi:hypothetical protein
VADTCCGHSPLAFVALVAPLEEKPPNRYLPARVTSQKRCLRAL